MNLNDERFREACMALAGARGISADRVAELAWIGITGQAQAGVMSLGIPLVGMTEDERLEHFITRAHELAGAA
jgi:hypothetical protein